MTHLLYLFINFFFTQFCIVTSGGRSTERGECLRLFGAGGGWSGAHTADQSPGLCQLPGDASGSRAVVNPPHTAPRSPTCSAETPAAAAAPGPSLPPAPPPPLDLARPIAQDGKASLQFASKQKQLVLVQEARRRRRSERLSQPGLRLPVRPGCSWRQPGDGAGQRHESAAGAQEAAGRSAEQIHQPAPRLAEQVGEEEEDEEEVSHELTSGSGTSSVHVALF